jgi:gamma-glutamyl:cysteine ligase YbdK (ATP-grasp superfamily)
MKMGELTDENDLLREDYSQVETKLGNKKLSELVEENEFSTLGAGLVGQLVHNTREEGRKAEDDWDDEITRAFISDISEAIASELNPQETYEEDIDEMSSKLYKQFAQNHHGMLKFVSNYLKNGLETDLEAYGSPREEMEYLIKGGIRNGFRKLDEEY